MATDIEKHRELLDKLRAVDPMVQPLAVLQVETKVLWGDVAEGCREVSEGSAEGLKTGDL